MSEHNLERKLYCHEWLIFQTSFLFSFLPFLSYSVIAPPHLPLSAGPRRVLRAAVVPEVTHLELLVVVSPDVQMIHKQDTERYILTNLNIVSVTYNLQPLTHDDLVYIDMGCLYRHLSC